MKGMTRTSGMYMKAKMTESTWIFFQSVLFNNFNLDVWMTGMDAMTRVTTITMMTRMIILVG